HSVAHVVSCKFEANSAADNGGGVAFNGGSGEVTNCTFVDNYLRTGGSPAETGAGMYNNAAPTQITNCTFVSNNAAVTSGLGGGIYVVGSNPQIGNCIFWNNVDSGTSGSAQIRTAGGAVPAVQYCLVQGGYAGPGILSTDPHFMQPPDPDPDKGVYGDV